MLNEIHAFPVDRKRQGSPTRGRPPAGKRKQKSKVVCEEKVEEESASESVTPEPVHPSTRLLAAPHSNLATASKARCVIDQAQLYNSNLVCMCVLDNVVCLGLQIRPVDCYPVLVAHSPSLN